ncbi:methyltransferase domain-containing protein, partial [Thermoplasma sp.]|uniref:methyltransferase domain-containing protein n=1 Tax=Thermoplasma sp. TaxID=1973142 RepID=UPI0012873145
MDERSYFDENAARYDAWYEAHPDEYRDQVGFIGRLMPHGIGVEIGVGTGRFASKLGIKVGVDVSERMLSVAARRGILPILASAENLPFISGYFRFLGPCTRSIHTCRFSIA